MNNMDKITFEEMFARDLIRFTLHEYMLGLLWKPTGVFTKEDVDTPFNLELRSAVKEELDYNGHRFHKHFDEIFPDKSVLQKNYAAFCFKTKDGFLRGTPNVDMITFCVCLAMFAGLSYLYGANLAPYQTYMTLVSTFRELKLLDKVGENLTEEMEFWLERRHRLKRKWVSEFVSYVGNEAESSS